MVAKSAFSVVGLAHKVCLTAEAQGYTPELLNTLAESPNLFQQLLQVQLGQAEIVYPDHLVDCDLDPTIPDGWKLEEHQRGGKVKIKRVGDDLYANGVKIDLFLTDAQKKYSFVGYKIRDELKGKPVLNACVLDYLLAHPHLIPESWKQDEQGRTRYIYFWGTIFRRSDNLLYVGYLRWNGYRWHCNYYLLDHDFGGQHPAAVCAMPTSRQAA